MCVHVCWFGSASTLKDSGQPSCPPPHANIQQTLMWFHTSIHSPVTRLNNIGVLDFDHLGLCHRMVTFGSCQSYINHFSDIWCSSPPLPPRASALNSGDNNLQRQKCLWKECLSKIILKRYCQITVLFQIQQCLIKALFLATQLRLKRLFIHLGEMVPKTVYDHMFVVIGF